MPGCITSLDWRCDASYIFYTENSSFLIFGVDMVQLKLYIITKYVKTQLLKIFKKFWSEWQQGCMQRNTTNNILLTQWLRLTFPFLAWCVLHMETCEEWCRYYCYTFCPVKGFLHNQLQSSETTICEMQNSLHLANILWKMFMRWKELNN